MKMMVDPPSGWRFGFPALLDTDKETFLDLLIRHKYPVDDMPLAMKYSRYWEPEGENAYEKRNEK